MKKFNPNYIMLTFAAIAAGVLWINVFARFHDGVLAYIGGVPAGISIVGLVVNAANSLPRVQSKRARQAGWFFLGLVVVVEPVVLWSANYPVVTHTTITPLAANVVSGGAGLAITLSLILGALVDRSLVPAEKPSKPQKSAEAPVTVRSAKGKTAQQPLSEIVCRYAGAGCGRKFASQNAANAHARSCGFKPTIAMPVDVSQKVAK